MFFTDVKVLHNQLRHLQDREQTLSKEKEDMEADFGQKRARFKELYLQKEEELRQEQENMESVKKAKESLEAEVKKIQAELNEARSLVTIAECQKENEIESERRKCHEEIASLQHIMKEAVSDAMRSTSSHFEKEISRLQTANQRLEAELQELRSERSKEREGVLAAVTKTLKQRVGNLSPHPFSTSNDSNENLEDSMKKAQEDAEMLKSLVVPLEEEIRVLKDKLRSTDGQLRMYETAFSGLVKGLGSGGDLADLIKGKTPAEVVGHLDDKLTSLSQGLQAEKASRTDLEMYVAVLNTQKAVMQEDVERVKQESKDILLQLEREKKEHAALKKTWQMANDQFLEAQQLQMMDMRRMQSVLTTEQQRQINELQKKDGERLDQEQRITKLQQLKEELDRKQSEREVLTSSPRLSTSRDFFRMLSPLPHQRLKSTDSASSEQVSSSFAYQQRARSTPENLSLAGLDASQERLGSGGSRKRRLSSLRKSISSSALDEREENECTDESPETLSLVTLEDLSSSPWSPKKISSLAHEHVKGMSASRSLLNGMKTENDSMSLVGKRLVTEKEWQSLEEEVKRAREKIGQPCAMCSNYEVRLQQAQQSEATQRQQVTGLQQVIAKYKEDLQREQNFRHELEQKFNKYADDYKKEVSELFSKFEEAERLSLDLKASYTACYNDVYDQLKKLKSEKEKMKASFTKLQAENNSLMAKHIARAQQIQSEVINLPNTAEEMQFLYLKLREDLITAQVAKEQTEESLKSEILFLRDQLMGEQNAKETLEDTLTQEIDHLREQLGIFESIKTEFEIEKSKRTEVEQKLKHFQSHVNQAHGEGQKHISELKKTIEETGATNLMLEEEVQQLKSKVQSLQTELDNSEAVQKDFVKLSQSLQMELEKIRQSDNEVRWQHEDDINACNSCKKVLHSKKEKHHCNHCGKIFCAECSSKIVYSGPKQRPFKVCSVCHTLLDHETAPYFSSRLPQTPS
ncbi:rab GTPase-binding effector protein 1-like isoform X2 [Tachypleus tridentatus]|uniref:rab GTPase-binding effector protein 1-like isoform X2 n=1 Tax=Tachypleus tridentatus TaxID=6853 RepID=UPI003FD5647E